MPFFQKDRVTGFVHNEDQASDPRNLSYAEMAFGSGIEIPKEGNVLQRPQEILDQGHTSSCTAHATVTAVYQTTGKLLSPRYAFHRIKTDSKYPSSQLPFGAYMKDNASLLVNEGICEYEYLPNIDTDSNERFLQVELSPFLRENARKNAGGSYVYATLERGSQAIFDATVRLMVEQKIPVQVGVDFFQEFPEYGQVRKTGIYPAKNVGGQSVGHDMCAVAWKEIDGEPYIGFQQSFSKDWGDKGMCWMPRNYTKFYSPIAIFPDIKKPTWEEKRNIHKERANAQELKALVDIKFPRVGDKKEDAQNQLAQSIFGKDKLVYVNAVSHLGWKFTDVINNLNAKSRSKINTVAYSLDFTIKRYL